MNPSLTPEQEAEAQQLEAKIRHALEQEVAAMARLLVGKPERELFGQTEFQLRDILLRVGAKVYEEHLREKKTATRAPASSVPTAAKPPSSTATGPSRP